MDYARKTYKVSEIRGAGGVNKDFTGNFSRDQAHRLEKKQEHEKKLHKIIRLHKLWRELSANLSQTDSTLSALSESIEQEKNREKDLLSENNKLKGILSQLQTRGDLSRQVNYLRTLRDRSISYITGNILGRITNDRKKIRLFEGKVVNLENSYQGRHEIANKWDIRKKGEIYTSLKKLQIEIREEDIDKYLSKFEITIESVEDFIKTLHKIDQQYEYIISSGKAAEDGDKKRDQAWIELQSTTFYRERVAPLADKVSAESQIGALTQVIQLAPNPELKIHSRLRELQDIFDNNLKRLYPDRQETIAPGYSAARSLYKALLKQDTQALRALEKKNTLQANISKPPRGKQAKAQWKVEKPRLEQGLQWLNTAIEKLNASEEQQLASYREFIEQSSRKSEDIPGYSETTLLYRAIRESNKAYKEANGTFSELQENINSYELEIPKLKNAEQQHDDAEFGPKLKAYIEACLYMAKQLQEHMSYSKAVCDFYKSMAVTPLKETISEIQASISSSRKDIDDYTTTCHNKGREKQTIKRNIQKVLSQAVNDTGRNISREDLDLFDRYTDDWFIEQRKQHEQAIQRLTPQPSSAQPDSILTVQGIMEQGKVNEQSRKWLQRQEVADYTDKLLEAHRHQYGTEINFDKAVKSAKFLADQKFVGETRKYIEITAGLVHKFDVGLDSFYVNTETLQITIAEESSTKSFTGGPISDEPLSYGGDGPHARKTIVGPTSGSGRSDTLVSGSGRSNTLVSDGSFRIGSKQQQENLVPHIPQFGNHFFG